MSDNYRDTYYTCRTSSFRRSARLSRPFCSRCRFSWLWQSCCVPSSRQIPEHTWPCACHGSVMRLFSVFYVSFFAYTRLFVSLFLSRSIEHANQIEPQFYRRHTRNKHERGYNLGKFPDFETFSSEILQLWPRLKLSFEAEAVCSLSHLSLHGSTDCSQW